MGTRFALPAAPGLTPDIRLAIEGETVHAGEGMNADVVTDPGWDSFRSLVHTHGLVPAWSVPVAIASGEPSMGVVIILAEPGGRVTADERRLLELSGRLTAIAVKEAANEVDLAYRATRDVLTGLANRAAFPRPARAGAGAWSNGVRGWWRCCSSTSTASSR